MGYYVSNIIGIRTGGVFSGEKDVDDIKQRIKKIVLEMREESEKKRGEVFEPDLGWQDGDPSHCMCDKELVGSKGSYVVLAGVFNYWTFDKAEQFAKRLSEEFGTHVMLMSWDEEHDIIKSDVYLGGKSIREINEDPISRAFRRIV